MRPTGRSGRPELAGSVHEDPPSVDLANRVAPAAGVSDDTYSRLLFAQAALAVPRSCQPAMWSARFSSVQGAPPVVVIQNRVSPLTATCCVSTGLMPTGNGLLVTLRIAETPPEPWVRICVQLSPPLEVLKTPGARTV